jgi:hypothetical protein
MELASMLAGERFTDHPSSVCPVIGGFLRGYNDLLPEGQHDELYPYAARIVGTAAPPAVRRERARHILAWARCRRPRVLRIRLRPWDFVLLPAVQAALRMPRDMRRAEVSALLEDLIAIGGTPDPVVPPAAPQSHGAPREPAASARG